MVKESRLTTHTDSSIQVEWEIIHTIPLVRARRLGAEKCIESGVISGLGIAVQ